MSLNIRPLAQAVSRGRQARHPTQSVRLKSRLRSCLTTVLALTTVIASLISPALVTVTNAASGSDYLDQATDPHGGVWLRGTTNGQTSGPMDPGTNPASASFGHLWTTDVPSGFCRVVVPTDGSASFLDRNTPGGCITTGGKSSQAVTDPRRRADGTFYVYTCDWAVFSQGCFRMTYDPGTQTMTNSELLAPGRFPTNGTGKKPFATALGTDGNLYVTSDITPYIYRFTAPNDPNTGNQTIQIVATSNDNSRMRAITWACWDPLRGGTTGLPTCSQSAAAGDPAPDLVLDQKSKMTVLMDPKKCVGVNMDLANGGVPLTTPSCLPVDVPISVQTPMGAYTEGAWDMALTAPAAYNPSVKPTYTLPSAGGHFDPNVIYITDSPGALSQVIRYHINTNTQDSYANFGVFADGSTRTFSFGFSLIQAPDGSLYLGDDPTAGANAFQGNIWRIFGGAPADALGAPGQPAFPPPPPSQKVGSLYGSGVTLPNDGLWLPRYSDAAGTTIAFNPDGSPTGHLWMADGAAGFCRMDANPAPGPQTPPSAAGAPFFMNTSTCNIFSATPGQSALDPKPQPDGTHIVYVTDASTRGLGLFRLTYDWAGTVCKNPDGSLMGPESMCNPIVVAPGKGLEGQRADAVAIDPSVGANGAVYVGFLNRNTSLPTILARVNNPATANETVDFVANTTRQRPIFTLAFVKNPGDPNQSDLYIGDNGGVELLANPKSCQPGGCNTILVLDPAPVGMATDGVDKLYMASPSIPTGCPPTCPADGTIKTEVDVFSVQTGDFSVFSTLGAFADASVDGYDVVDSLTVDPKGNVYVGDDPSSLGVIIGQGRVFQVAGAAQEPLPAIVSKPNSPTNQANPTFGFQSGDTAAKFKCSLTPLGTADSFANCSSPATFGATAAGSNTAVLDSTTPLADGTYVFKVEGVGTAGTSFVNSYLFRIDTVKPVVTITSSPTSPSNDNTPTFTAEADKAGTILHCSLSSGPDNFQVCTSPITYPAQSDGAHTFKVFGVDAAGNQSATVSTTLTIDTVAPSVAADPQGGDFTTPQTVTLTASEPAAIFYTTDGTAPTTTSTTGPSPVSVAIPGSQTLRYFAVDAAGNTGPSASQTYRIGSVTLSQNPPTLSNKNTPTFAFTSSVPGATFQCSLVLQTAVDSFSACTSPKTYTAQPDGAYRFVVTDSNGDSAQFLFTIDTTPPVVSLTQNPANPLQGTSATFAFTSNELVTGYQCSFGLQTAADAFSGCTSPTTFSGLADGNYIFKVEATDRAGNAGTPTTYEFAVSAKAPPSITKAPTASLIGLITAQTGTSAVTNATGPITAKTTGVPVTISWAGTACQSGGVNCNVDHYILQQSVNGAAFGNVTLPAPDPSKGPATSITLSHTPSPVNNSSPATTYRYQVAAVDKDGKQSAFTPSAAFTVPDTDNKFSSSFNGSWSGVNLSSAFAGSVQQSSTAGATAKPSNAAPATTLAWVSTLGPDRGKAQVQIDGQTVATVDLYAPTETASQVVWSINGLAPNVNHSIQIVSTGTRNSAATAAKVDYDAILALK
jgi:chitobiase/beta-hexosaminidase-like protein